MYQPPLFRETRPEVLHALIRNHPLGLLICNGSEGPVANPLPFLIDADVGPNGRLRAHLARANPQWRLLADTPDTPVLVVFQGADSYITPSWYETKRETGKVVPTWNYAMVQVRGTARVIDDADWLMAQISVLTRQHEEPREKPWAVGDAPEAYIRAHMRGIIGVEIEIAAIEGKWKVSQNRPVADREGVAAGLDDAGDQAEMTGLVRRYGGLPESN
jgi:transcriptional regulator